MLINNSSSWIGCVSEREKVGFLAQAVLSISNNFSYVAYLAQITSKNWKGPNLKVCEASPRARHYDVCLSTAHSLRWTPALLRRERRKL